MILITEELVRKRSEHNEGIIGTLEELSLHQEDIEKIEHLNNWCKQLQILYLQANQIGKIENLNKLKKLEYLNLAINNIEKIENLAGCESLNKLDLTLNFIGDLESVKSLKANINLKDLYLTGNPCCDYKGYREYVIAHLPQLQCLDVVQITRSERIRAQQNIEEIEKSIKIYQDKYRRFREEQKTRLLNKDSSYLTDEEFWKTASENSPETRLDIARRQQKQRENIADIDSNKEKPRTLRLHKIISLRSCIKFLTVIVLPEYKNTCADDFALSIGRRNTGKVIRVCQTQHLIKIVEFARLFNKDGRPLNVNQAKLSFTFSDENPEELILDVAVYKYLDTSLIDIDLQPIYVKLTVKGKIFQIVFPEEIHVEKSTALRSQTTGHLVLKLPRFNYKPPVKKKPEKQNLNKYLPDKQQHGTKTEYLEVTGKNDDLDFSNIIENNRTKKDLFVDNLDVPMLEYG